MRTEEPITIIHVYVPTDERPTVKPINVEDEIRSKVVTITGYKNVADELTSKA